MIKVYRRYLYKLQECDDVRDALYVLDEAADDGNVTLKEYLHLRFVFDLVDWDSYVKE